jgi:hypothetical protein
VSHPDAIEITLRPLAGTGSPPQWSFSVIEPGGIHAQMSGPRILVLETLARWVSLFEESSRPEQPT